METHSRTIQPRLATAMKDDKVVVLVGPRQAGKTTLLRWAQAAAQKSGEDTAYLNLEKPGYREALNADPDALFDLVGRPAGSTRKTVFLDEIQLLKDPSSFLKYLYDEYRGKLKLAVTGSSSFYIDRDFKDSLVGRKTLLNVWTLDFPEFLEFRGEPALAKAVRKGGPWPKVRSQALLSYFKEFAIYGGYPEVTLAPTSDRKREILDGIATDYVRKDVAEAGIERSDRYFYLLKILASQAGGLVNLSELSRTLAMPLVTVERYFYVARRSYHMAAVRPFSGNARKELTRMPKAYFVDAGLRNALLKNFETWEERVDRGAVLENVTFRQLLARAGTADDIFFWRTQNGNEVDFVSGGRAVECRANPDSFDPKKYALFQESYPKIPLTCVGLEGAMAL